MLNTPILFLIFNREDTTLKVLEAIKMAKPTRLYIASDGPRATRPAEASVCEKIRAEVLKRIDWPCEVKTLFRENNLGCKVAVSSAIDWFFENEEIGIILEDDCYPSSSFFKFIDELLNKYKNDERIGMISGDNFLPHKKISHSYLYSSYYHIWGWATWRRAWKKYDVNIKGLNSDLLREKFSDVSEFNFWNEHFKLVHE